ncbi:aldo/keto reductase [Kitasatospora atroaurantiaca]|uniref:Aryl-alcohol dehydrogenase-like predicted oxidoreductase n=1 Tax=Kitasatospora atroaurantiaca TaxID=285545 RepID=A0A561ENR3_9ACTN|nr:aldo/keto reductase [Kitasatospora atroaurantiaca]TWE17263.1 aryl-alcohol dehydrogenase-like predicted oxidoreductase [Kitasatospora atroaurantiaca]
MSVRTLGTLTTSPIGFGAMVLSPGMYGEIDDDRAERALRAALDAGATLIDTADGYGVDGHNEKVVGRAIAGRRDEVVLATKFGFRIPEGAESHRFPVTAAFGELALNADPKYVRGYAEQSLRNLGTDVIDLYYPHFPDPEVPFEETVGAVAELIGDGLVRQLGLSNVTAAQLRRAHAVHPVAAVQVQWSMWVPVDPELLATARELGVGLVAWSPLGGGFLTGTVQQLGEGDFRRNLERFDEANLKANNDRYAPLRGIAADLGLTPGQLALAWLLHQDEHVVPIPGSRTPAHIADNLAAARVELHPETLERITEALDRFAPVGRGDLLEGRTDV